jgi:hypothetical protein
MERELRCMPHINSPELAIFKEAAFTVLEFTDDEYRELQRLAQQLSGIFQKAKQRQAA